VAGPCEHNNVPSGSIKYGKFLDQLSDCLLLKDSVLETECDSVDRIEVTQERDQWCLL